MVTGRKSIITKRQYVPSAIAGTLSHAITQNSLYRHMLFISSLPENHSLRKPRHARRRRAGPVRAQPTVHRRRRHRDQQRRRRIGNDQLLEAPQPRHQLRHDRGEALARRATSTAQHNASATTSGPYRGGRGARGRTSFGVNAAFSALRAWLRCHPVVAHNSSRILPFSALLARSYRVAIVVVTACCWPTSSVPSTRAYRPQPSHPCRRGPTRVLQRESTTTLTRACLMSQRGGLRVSGGRDKAGCHD